MTYYVSVAVDGRIDIKVDAKSFAEAKEKAMDAFMFADLSNMEIVDSFPVNGIREEDEAEIDYI